MKNKMIALGAAAILVTSLAACSNADKKVEDVAPQSDISQSEDTVPVEPQSDDAQSADAQSGDAQSGEEQSK